MTQHGAGTPILVQRSVGGGAIIKLGSKKSAQGIGLGSATAFGQLVFAIIGGMTLLENGFMHETCDNGHVSCLWQAFGLQRIFGVSPNNQKMRLFEHIKFLQIRKCTKQKKDIRRY